MIKKKKKKKKKNIFKITEKSLILFQIIHLLQ